MKETIGIYAVGTKFFGTTNKLIQKLSDEFDVVVFSSEKLNLPNAKSIKIENSTNKFYLRRLLTDLFKKFGIAKLYVDNNCNHLILKHFGRPMDVIYVTQAFFKAEKKKDKIDKTYKIDKVDKKHYNVGI